jgi:hypothetical protein
MDFESWEWYAHEMNEVAILTEMIHEPLVFIIDSLHWPRAYLRAELIERGLDAVGFINPQQALAVLNHPWYPRPRLIVLELFELEAKRSEIAAVARFGIPTIVLVGAVQMNEQWIRGCEWADVIQRPFRVGDVADSAEKLIKDTNWGDIAP